MHNDRYPEGFLNSRNRAFNDADDSGLLPRKSSEVGSEVRLVPSFETLEAVPVNPAATVRGRVAGRVRPVTRSPVQEFQARPGRVREIPVALKIALSGGRTKTVISRNGISFVPQLLNAEGRVKKLTWWSASSPICQDSNIGKTVTAVYDRMNCELIHLLDESGKYIGSLPLKDKTPWFDAEATQKAISETRRMAARVYDQLQDLHVDDSEAALDAAQRNKGRLENIVQTFPTQGRKAPARSSGNAKDLGVADQSFRGQKAVYGRQEAEIAARVASEGSDAAHLLFDDSGPAECRTAQTEAPGGDVIDFIL